MPLSVLVQLDVLHFLLCGAREQGIKVGLLRPITVAPFPVKRLRS